MILAILVGAGSHPLLGADRVEAAVETELAAYIDDLFDSEPAWGGALVAKDGQVLFENSYGWSNYGQAKSNQAGTVFRIQSSILRVT